MNCLVCRGILLVAAVLLPGPPSARKAGAQSTSTPATVTGTVSDPSGALIAHASIRLFGAGVDRSVESDSRGRFTLSAPAGAYTLTLQAEGFAPFSSGTLHLTEGTPVRLPVRLAIAGREERLDVIEGREDATTPERDSDTLEISGAQLNLLSDDPATLQQQINALAGPGLGGLGPQILVNGFSNGRIPPKTAIRSIRINGNPFSAYYDSVGFGRVEIETKPGLDKLHGALDFAGTDQPFDARNPFDLGVLPPFYQFQTDGNLNGPITRNTSFFLAENIQDLANNAVINADTLDANLNQTNLSEAVSAPQLTQTYSLRVDHQFNPNNFGFLRDEWSQTHTTNSGLTSLVLPSAAFTVDTLTDTLQAADTQVLGAHAVNESRFQYLRTRIHQQPNSTAPAIDVEGAFLGGGSPTQVLRDAQDRYEVQDRFQFDRKGHSAQVGFRFRELREANDATAGFNGQYTFNDLTAFQLTERGIAAGLTPAQIRVEGGGASQFNLTVGGSGARLLDDDVGLFAEDDWKLRPGLTFSYGLRFESQSAIPDHADPAPRLGLVWAIRRGKQPIPVVVLRGGYGIFYDRFPAANLLQAIRQNGTTETAYFVGNPDTFPGIPPVSSLAATEPTIYRVSPTLHTGYNQVGSFGGDRPLGRRGVVSALLLYAHGTHEYLTRNTNAPLPGTYDPAVPTSGTRPLGTAQNIYQYSSDSNENDEVLLLHGNLQITKYLFVFAAYTAQRQRNESDGINSFPSNQYDLRADYGRAANIFAQSVQAIVSWSLPRGFGTQLFFTGHTGLPFNITTGTDLNGDTIFNDRPAFATDLTRPSVARTSLGNFDTVPIPGQTIVPHNEGVGPGLSWVDLQANKTYRVGPRRHAAANPAASPSPARAAPAPDRPWGLKFQVEAENALNHTNPGPPVGVIALQPCPATSAPPCVPTPSSYFNRSTTLATDFSPLTASNRTILLQVFFSF